MTSVALPVGRVSNPLRTLAWAGIVLGLAAAFIALPPIAARSWVPSLLLALLAIAAGVFVITRGETRFGWYAIASAVAHADIIESRVAGGVMAMHAPSTKPHSCTHSPSRQTSPVPSMS